MSEPVRDVSVQAGLEVSHFHGERRVSLVAIGPTDELPLNTSGTTQYEGVRFVCRECLERVDVAVSIEITGEA